MTRYSPVAPIQILEGLYAHHPNTFGDYHLLLAHHTVAHKKRFSDLFRRVEDSGLCPIIIMDNSIVELGNSVSFEMVEEATSCIAEACESATVIPVLPDVMGKGAETRELVAEHYDRWSREMSGNGFMVVCQGEDFEDYQESLKTFANKAEYPEITWLGVPRILHKTCGTRVHAAINAAAYQHTHSIHLLGFCDDIQDDMASSRIRGITGIDSAVPLRIREQFTQFVQASPRAPDWFDKAQVDTTMLNNLDAARKLFEQ